MKFYYKKRIFFQLYGQLIGIFFYDNDQGLIDYVFDNFIKVNRLAIIDNLNIERLKIDISVKVYKNQFAVKKNNVYSFQSKKEFLLRLIESLDSFFLRKNYILLHGSTVIDSRNNAYIFSGESGAGKTTITDILKEKYLILNDDSSLIKIVNKRVYVYQSLIFKNNMQKIKNNKHPVKKIYFIIKSNKNKELKINDLDEKIKRIMANFWTFKPVDLRLKFKSALRLLGLFDDFYYLFFTKDKDFLTMFIINNGL